MRKGFILSLTVFLVYSSLSFGYEDYLYKNYSVKEIYSLYDLVNNPAFLRLNNHEDLMAYEFNAGKQENGYRRTFDPEQIKSAGVDIFSYKALDDKSALVSRIIYETSTLNKLYRSLEKDFYSDYFSYTDTTTGDVTYAGPRLWILYNREILPWLTTGLQIDYGIERGLKDVYTKCETIARNINVNWGLGYSGPSGTALGVSIRYFDRQGSYEAVKEVTDAVVNTYMGYHLYYPERPRSTNEKKIYGKGIEIDAQLTRNGFLIPSLKIDLTGGYGTKENSIDAGSSSKPIQRGYWVREGGFVNSILSYGNDQTRFGLELMAGIKQYHDWASPGAFDVINIENDVTDIQYGIKTVIPMHSMTLTVGYEAGTEDVNYHEYTVDYVFDEQLSHSLIFMDFGIPLNQIMQMHYGIWFSKFEPYFYWNTSSIQTQGIELGVERLFVFGKIGASLQLEFWNPAEEMGSINRFGVAISFKK